MITVTKGQWFPLTIGNISYGGAAFDLQGATEVSASLVSTLGMKSPLNFEISAFNEISAVCDGSLSAGKYGIEVSCKGADGKAYRMKSPGAIIEVSSSTTSSTGSTSVRVVGDEWELTADVEMHEGQARTYMSLLEEVRQGAVKAAEEATEAASAINAAKAACEKQTDKAEKTNSDITAAETARVEAESGRVKAEQGRVTAENARVAAENKRAQSEQSREAAETDRANAEKARVAAETARAAAEAQRKDAEIQRETAFTTAKGACETATKNATAATDKANTAADKANDATAAATKAEQARVTAETDRVKAEQGRVTAEQGRVEVETARVEAETARVEAETERVEAENARKEAESSRASAETERQDAEDARKEAEVARVTAENGRATAEDGRSDAESRRQDNESIRVTAETEREQGFTEKAAHLDELLQYIKDNHLESDAKLAEAIKNTINGTDEFVYLDTNDGNVKSMPNTNQLGANVASVYYAGKRSIKPEENYQMFYSSMGNRLVRSLDLSGWGFEAATTMYRFSYRCSNVKTLTLPDDMTLANVTSMSQCFSGCGSLQSLDTSKWTLANVTSMDSCFFGCGSLQSLDTSKWTLANVTNMNSCFSGCGSLQSLDTSKWTLANVTSIYRCFYYCNHLREIDLSSCNITKCINWERWIYSCDLLTLRIGLIDFSLCGGVDFLTNTNIRELTGTLRGIKNNFTATSNRMTRDSCMVVINGLETVTEARTLTLGANNKPVSLGGKGNDPISDDDLKVATDKGWTVRFA